LGWIPKRAPKAQMRGVLNNKLKPLARSDDLVVEEIGDELLVADRTNNRAHSLNALAARVWHACDGETTTEQLVAKLDADPDAVAHALAELSDCELLESNGPVIVGNGGMTRRDLGVKAAKVGAAAAIISVALPVAEAAATPTPAACLLYTDSDCATCSNVCGCCCCGQAGGGGEPACKTCFTISGCDTLTFTGPPAKAGKCSNTSEHGQTCIPAAPSYQCKDGSTVTLANCNVRCCTHDAFTPPVPCP
jgi:coenzyme PQQ synthesis protein D (PqqD)